MPFQFGRQDPLTVPIFQAGKGICALRHAHPTVKIGGSRFRHAGFDGVTSHYFRKTVATLMDEAGLSARAAADQLGHAKPSLTTDIYMGRRKRATGAAEVLEDLFQF